MRLSAPHLTTAPPKMTIHQIGERCDTVRATSTCDEGIGWQVRPRAGRAGSGQSRSWATIKVINGIAIAVVTALAALARIWNLAEIPPGLSFDEAANILDSLRILEGGFRPIFVGNTPYGVAREAMHLYPQALLLKLFGEDQGYIIRYASAFAGAITVPLVYALASEMFPAGLGKVGRRGFALLSATLLAFSYWHIHVSRLGLRAGFLVPFEVATLYFLWRAARRDSPVASLLCGSLLSLALLSYFSARALPLAVIPLFAAAILQRQWSARRKALHAAFFLLGLCAFGVPFLYASIVSPADVWFRVVTLENPATKGASLLWDNFLATLGMFSLAGDACGQYNLTGRPVFRFPLDLFFYVGAVVCLLPLSPRVRRVVGIPQGSFEALPWLSLLTLLAIMLAPSFLSDRSPHFLRAVGALGPTIMLTSLGVCSVLDWAWRQRNRLALPAAALIIGVAVAWNAGSAIYDYFVVFPRSPDSYYLFDRHMIEASSAISAQASAKRVFVDRALRGHGTVVYYLRGSPVQWFDPSSTLVLPKGEAEYFWLTYNQGIEAFAGLSSVVRRREPVRDRYGQDTLIRFAASGGSANALEEPHWRKPIDGAVSFAPDFALEALALRKGSRWASGERLVPGETVSVVLAWRAHRDVVGDYAISVRLVDARGRSWVQKDCRPGQDTFPSSQWREGDLILDVHTLDLPPSLPPLQYRLEIQVYEANSKQIRAAIKDGVEVRAPIQLLSVETESAPAAVSPAIAPSIVLPGKECYGLRLLGHEPLPASVKPGEQMDVRLFWACTAPPQDLLIDLVIKDQAGESVASLKERPLDASFDTSRLAPGQVLVDVHRLSVSRHAGEGPTTLEIAVSSETEGSCSVVTLAGPRTEGRAKTFAEPAMPQTTNAVFGRQIALLGYGSAVESSGGKGSLGVMPKSVPAGSELRFAFAWRAVTEPSASYTVFLQLLNEEGRLVSQEDSLPLGGAAPTDTWVTGEVVLDEHVLPIPADVTRGRATVIVGFYDAQTGRRLAVGDGDYLRLGDIELVAEP
ncbi:MAG: ArnT family glycosyltransferase [Chloroflexota bacterium]